MKKKSISLLLTMLLLSFFAITNAFCLTFYVDTLTGKDNPSWGVKSGKPWKTISYAVLQTSIIEQSEEVLINVAAETYKENITIDKRSVSLVGTGVATIIDGGPGKDVITINGVQKVTIRGFTIQNGNKGIIGTGGSSFEVSDTTVQDCTEGGIQAYENSTLQVSDCTVQRNGINGILVYMNSSALFSGTIVCNNNGRVGFVIGGTSNAFLIGATLTTNDNGWRGINIIGSSSFLCSNSSLTSKNNSSVGVGVTGSSINFVGSTFLSENNTSTGLRLVGASQIWTDDDTTLTMRNNERGFQLAGSSYAEITGSLLVENSGKRGIMLNQNCGFEIGGSASVIVKGTTRDGVGIFIDDASSFNAFGTGELVVENNQMDGIWVLRGSGFETGINFSQIRNNGGNGIVIQQHSNGRLRSGTVIQNNISDGITVLDNSELFITDMLVENNGRGVWVDDGTVSSYRSTINRNIGDDIFLSFGSRASLYGDEESIGTVSCDGTELIRGNYACAP